MQISCVTISCHLATPIKATQVLNNGAADMLRPLSFYPWSGLFVSWFDCSLRPLVKTKQPNHGPLERSGLRPLASDLLSELHICELHLHQLFPVYNLHFTSCFGS